MRAYKTFVFIASWFIIMAVVTINTVIIIIFSVFFFVYYNRSISISVRISNCISARGNKSDDRSFPVFVWENCSLSAKFEIKIWKVHRWDIIKSLYLITVNKKKQSHIFKMWSMTDSSNIDWVKKRRRNPIKFQF